MVKVTILGCGDAFGAGGRLHSAYLVLVDREGRIRGAYLGTDLENQPQLIADIKKLLREPAT